MGASGDGAISGSLLVGVNRAGKSMNARKSFLFLSLIMVGACAIIMGYIDVA